MASPPARREWIPFLILLTALFATAATAGYAYVTGLRQEKIDFENAAVSVQSAIESRLDAYLAMLLGGAGLFAASEDVSRHEFRSYILRLDLPQRYRGIQGIGFSRVIRSGERERVLAEIRREFPLFRFWPEHDGDINAIVYLEPPDEMNLRAFGYDMGSEPTRADAMNRARDTGAAAATGRVRLVQEGPDAAGQAGFLIYVPVYRGGSVPQTEEQRRRTLVGFVYSPFRADDLLTNIIDGEAHPLVDVEVYDGQPREESLLHRSSPSPARGRFRFVGTLPVAGRTWTLVFHGSGAGGATASRMIVGLIVFAGLALSALLFVVTRGQVRGRMAAERTAEELRRTEERLRAADKAKDEFLATISHELRTPLNAIVGWTSMLSRGAVPPATQPHAIEVIARNAAAQTRLVEDLLDLSRAIAGHLTVTMTDVDVPMVLQAAVDSLRPTADEAGVVLEYQPATDLGHIRGDPGRIQQVINNLVGNAIKFTPHGGRVALRAERNAGTLVITVQDTGIGMEPGFVPHVFDRFRQADSSTTRSHAGAGLGLAITRHLVQLHGGTIEARSEGLGRGSTFTVRLPPGPAG